MLISKHRASTVRAGRAGRRGEGDEGGTNMRKWIQSVSEQADRMDG